VVDSGLACGVALFKGALLVVTAELIRCLCAVLGILSRSYLTVLFIYILTEAIHFTVEAISTPSVWVSIGEAEQMRIVVL